MTELGISVLTGGTDGGNAAVLLRNAAALAGAEPLREVPVVVAGNREAAPTAAATLAAGGRTVTCVENVLPAIGTIEPAAARSAIRAAFLDHVIGGKHLTADPAVLAEYERDLVLKALVRRSCACEQAPEKLRAQILTQITTVSVTTVEVRRQG